jgi:hypothetical protein
MLVAFCADKGSPGVTTSTLVLGCAWAGPATVVEADAAGGDLALRLHSHGGALPETPTVLTVLTAVRSDGGHDPVSEHSHVLNSTTSVVPGALLAEHLVRAGDWLPLAEGLARRDEATFLDLGRVTPGSPLLVMAARAALVVVVARPDVPSIIRLRERLIRLASDLAQLRGSPPRLMPLLVTAQRHGATDVDDVRRVLNETPAKPFIVDVGFLAFDPAAVRRLEAGGSPAGRLARTDLMRTARAVVRQLADILRPDVDESADDAVGLTASATGGAR